MSSDKISLVLEGNVCALDQSQVMQLGLRCSNQSFPLDRIIKIGKTLFRAEPEACMKFFEYIEKNEFTRSIYKDFIHQPFKVQIYYSLAALSLSKALRENDKAAIEKGQKEFNKYLNLGSQIRSSAQKIYQLLHGFNSYYAGDFSKAIANFNRLEQSEKKDSSFSTIALLGLAQSYYIFRNYEKALEYYKKALLSNKNLPIRARLGMAYCFFQLQKYELAERCFARIISLDQKCAEAYIGLATVHYRNGDTVQYLKNLKKAYFLKPNDPLVLLHLCEHLLIKQDYQKCLILCQKGLKSIQTMPKFLKRDLQFRDDYEALKARFNNLIGQVHHAQEHYEEARKHYELAKQKGLKHNDLALAQTYMHSNMLKEAMKIIENVYASLKPAQVKLVADFYKTIAYLQVKMQLKPASEQKGPYGYYKQALKYNKNDYDTLIDYSVYLSEVNEKKLALKALQSALKVAEESGSGPRVELLNNIAVFYIEEKQSKQALAILTRALSLLQKTKDSVGEQQVTYHSLYLTIWFNYAVALEQMNRISEAIQCHQQLLAFNKYYVDSYVKLAELLHLQGSKVQALEVLDTAVNMCAAVKSNEIRVDKLITMKGHLQHVDGNNSEAKQSFKKLGANKFQYEKLYELSINYEIIIRKQVDRMVLKDFLRPNREYCIEICNGDPYSAHGFMMLIILFLIDNRITTEQAVQYFNQLKIAEQEFPQIQYNYGVFSILSEDYDNALFCLTRFKERTGSTKADEYIALAYFLKGDYNEAINTIKRSIVNEPHNLRYRFQYAYVNEKRIHKLYEEQKNFRDLKMSTKYLNISKKIYESLSKVMISEYVKYVIGSDTKERLRNEIAKIRAASEDRERYVHSQLAYYGEKEKEIVEKERKIKEEEHRKLQQLKRIKENKMLIQQIDEDEDESEGERMRKQKRRKLIELSMQESERANEAWKKMQQENQFNVEGEQGKKKKRNSTGGKRSRKDKKKDAKEEEEPEEPSEEQFKEQNNSQQDNDDQFVNNDQEDDYERKKKKKKKNKNRDRDGSEDDKKKKKKKKKMKKQREQDEERSVKDEQKSGKNSEGNLDDMSNPFSDSDDLKQEGEAQSEEKPQKKKKKDSNKDDDEIDLNQFMIEP